MVELVEWDRARTILGRASDAHGGVWDSEKTDVFVNDGAFLFRSILATLHGAPGAFDKRNTKRWLKHSEKSRRQVAKEAEGDRAEGAPLVVRPDKRPFDLTDEDRDHLIPMTPEISYSGGLPAPSEPEFDDFLGITGSGAVQGEATHVEPAASAPATNEPSDADDDLTDGFVCPECGAEFADLTSYTEHLSAAHGADPTGS